MTRKSWVHVHLISSYFLVHSRDSQSRTGSATILSATATPRPRAIVLGRSSSGAIVIGNDRHPERSSSGVIVIRRDRHRERSSSGASSSGGRPRDLERSSSERSSSERSSRAVQWALELDSLRRRRACLAWRRRRSRAFERRVGGRLERGGVRVRLKVRVRVTSRGWLERERTCMLRSGSLLCLDRDPY